MNKQQYIIISKINSSEVTILIIGAVSTIFLGGYFILNKKGWIGIPITAFGLYCIYILINYPILYINKNEVLIKSITGLTKKKIPLTSFKYYTEIEKENAATNLAHRKWRDLTLFSDNFILKISSLTYTNYSELKKILTKGLKKNQIAEREWNRKNGLQWGYGLLLSGLILGGFLFRNGIPHNEEISSFILVIILLLPILVGVNLIKKNKKARR
jgi:hypothetical protein